MDLLMVKKNWEEMLRKTALEMINEVKENKDIHYAHFDFHEEC
jgi:predicted aldo/keto reductase-like oxidoreductase